MARGPERRARIAALWRENRSVPLILLMLWFVCSLALVEVQH